MVSLVCQGSLVFVAFSFTIQYKIHHGHRHISYIKCSAVIYMFCWNLYSPINMFLYPINTFFILSTLWELSLFDSASLLTNMPNLSLLNLIYFSSLSSSPPTVFQYFLPTVVLLKYFQSWISVIWKQLHFQHFSRNSKCIAFILQYYKISNISKAL